MDINTLERKSVEIICSYLSKLVDNSMEETMMLNKGLQSFIPPLRFVESLCESQDEFEEYKNFKINLNKTYVVRSDKCRDWFINTRDLADIRCAETGNAWDRYVASLDRRIEKMRLQDPEGLKKLFKPYLDEMYYLWLEEVNKFSTGQYLKLDNTKIPDRKKLYKEVMKSNAIAIGFSYDKELSTNSRAIFSKNSYDPWKICFVVDNVCLNRPVDNQPSITNGAIQDVLDGGNAFYQYGSELEMSFGLIHKENLGTNFSKRGKYLLFNCRNFFPISVYGFQVYSKFYTLKELEASINIILTLYEIIQVEFESALFNGLKKCSEIN